MTTANTAKPTRTPRRRWLWASGGLLGGGGLLKMEANRTVPVLESVAVPLHNLPVALEGLTIAQLSDLHCGPIISEEQIRRAVDLALSVSADLIVVTGDFLSRSGSYLDSCARELARLRAPLGVFGVLGNHDLWVGNVPATLARLEQAGIQMLVNRHRVLRTRGAAICLAGIDDLWSGQPDVQGALAGAPTGLPRILLAHEPDIADEAARHGVDLQLSGHSHGGQVRLPGIGALVLPKYARKYPIGLQRVENSRTWVYTNRGIGMVRPAIRINCPPEVTALTLRRA